RAPPRLGPKPQCEIERRPEFDLNSEANRARLEAALAQQGGRLVVEDDLHPRPDVIAVALGEIQRKRCDGDVRFQAELLLAEWRNQILVNHCRPLGRLGGQPIPLWLDSGSRTSVATGHARIRR
ncbi:MAG: hypothetical protein WBG92_15595, partial [Thiohalocapsa sp.]